MVIDTSFLARLNCDRTVRFPIMIGVLLRRTEPYSIRNTLGRHVIPITALDE
jgi:hypothetical protein